MLQAFGPEFKGLFKGLGVTSAKNLTKILHETLWKTDCDDLRTSFRALPAVCFFAEGISYSRSETSMLMGRAKAWEEFVSTNRNSPVDFAKVMTKIAKECDEGESSKIKVKMYFAVDNTFTCYRSTSALTRSGPLPTRW